MSVADRANFVRRVFHSYGVLVDFEGVVPTKLRQRLEANDDARETLSQFCQRVLERKRNEVVVLAESSAPGQTQLGSLKLNSSAEVLAKALKPAVVKASKAKAKPGPVKRKRPVIPS